MGYSWDLSTVGIKRKDHYEGDYKRHPKKGLGLQYHIERQCDSNNKHCLMYMAIMLSHISTFYVFIR